MMLDCLPYAVIICVLAKSYDSKDMIEFCCTVIHMVCRENFGVKIFCKVDTSMKLKRTKNISLL